MSYFAVIREAGPGWTGGGIAGQPAVNDHAGFMNALADSGFVVFAGPLAGTESGRLRALLIVDADTEDAAEGCSHSPEHDSRRDPRSNTEARNSQPSPGGRR